MADYLIGRVAVVDEDTGEQTPIDARTRAEAVATDEDKTGGGKKTLEDKLSELNAHIADLAIHSTASLKIIAQITIPATGWTAATPVDGSEYAMTVDVTVQGVLETHMPAVALDVVSLGVADQCGLCPTVQSLTNTLRFWARETPSAAMTGTLSLFGEGGLSGDFDDEGGGD